MIINRVPRPKRFGRKIFERIEYKINYKIASSMINKKKKTFVLAPSTKIVFDMLVLFKLIYILLYVYN